MKMSKYYIVVLIIGLVMTSSAYADVEFIVKTDDIANSSSKTADLSNSDTVCKRQGFSISASTCTGDTLPGLLCPVDPRYTNECCSLKYSYIITSSCSNNTIPSQDTCGGRYRCVCDPVQYPKGPDRELCTGKFAYDEINYCAETYFDANGGSYETRYFKNCTCSSDYARCNSAYNLVGVGEGCTYKENTYYRDCKCDTGYNKLCLSSGAKHSSDYCLFKGKRYYRECNNIENNDKSDLDTMESTEQ